MLAPKCVLLAVLRGLSESYPPRTAVNPTEHENHELSKPSAEYVVSVFSPSHLRSNVSPFLIVVANVHISFDRAHFAILPNATTIRRYILYEEEWMKYRVDRFEETGADPGRPVFENSVYAKDVHKVTVFDIWFKMEYTDNEIPGAGPTPDSREFYRTFPRPQNAHRPFLPQISLIISPAIGKISNAGYILSLKLYNSALDANSTADQRNISRLP